MSPTHDTVAVKTKVLSLNLGLSPLGKRVPGTLAFGLLGCNCTSNISVLPGCPRLGSCVPPANQRPEWQHHLGYRQNSAERQVRQHHTLAMGVTVTAAETGSWIQSANCIGDATDFHKGEK